jgi:hypothetical protein
MDINTLMQNEHLINLFNIHYPDLKFKYLDEDLAKDIVESVMGMSINNIINTCEKDIIEETYDLANQNIPEMLIPSKLIVLTGKINELPIKILVDTGANCNCIYKSKIIKAGLEKIVDKEVKTVIAGIQSNKETFGKIWYTEIELEIIDPSKNKSYAIIGLNLTVVDDDDNIQNNEHEKSSFDLILGLNFLKSYRANIDFSKNIITLNNNIQIKFD